MGTSLQNITMFYLKECLPKKCPAQRLHNTRCARSVSPICWGRVPAQHRIQMFVMAFQSFFTILWFMEARNLNDFHGLKKLVAKRGGRVSCLLGVGPGRPPPPTSCKTIEISMFPMILVVGQVRP